MRLLSIFLVFFVFNAFGQQRKIEGTLKTAKGLAVSHASVMLKNSNNRILTFKPSDANGNFQIVVPDTATWSELFIEINHLGYAKINQPFKDGIFRYDILMEEKTINLDEIEVRNRPRIDSYGDTLSYDVGSFARQEDRTIGDVLKRMPGMEVSESGQIKYNDKPISNFYIDGDDLLDDKYAIGTKTIPHAMVQKLEVMQNHQPLKVLRNKSLSDNVAINLVIKDDAKLKMTGQLKLGAGLPQQYDVELNSILFNKKYKMLNVAQGNNIGNDLRGDFASLGIGNLLSGSSSRPQALLSTGIGSPSLSKNRYYMNNSGSLNANNLVNLNNGLQLKSNIRGFIDKNEQEASHSTEVFATGDTIRFWEQQAIIRDPFITELTLNAQANQDTYYFNNALKINYSGESANSAFQSNSESFSQNLHSRVRDFSNDLKYVPELKNGNVLNFSWQLSYFSQPQTLSIAPGLNADVLNEGREFAEINQQTEIPAWYNRVSVGYQLPKGKIRQSYNLSSTTEFQQLQSALRLMQLDQSVTPYTGSNDNNLNWKKNELSASGNYELKQGRLEASLTLPLVYRQITYADPAFDLETNKSRFLFSPSLRTKIMTTAEDYISFNYRYGEQTGNIAGVYRGAILTGYRTLRANDAALQESKGHSGSLHYNFQRSISMLFMNAGISYNYSMANTITASVLTDNISQTILIPFENDISSFGASAGISKYIFALGATAGLKGSWSTSRLNQFLNGESLPFHNINWTISPIIETRLWNKLSVNYEGSAGWTISRSAREAASSVLPEIQMQQFTQSLSLSYAPFRSLFLSMIGRHQYVSQSNMSDLSYFFMDAKARYTLRKWRTDFDLDLTNLANVKQYETFSLTANQFGHSQYQLRGRMLVLKATFNL